LRFFGAKIGRGVHIYPTVRIAVPWNLHIADEASVGDSVILYSLGSIFIGRSATVSQHAHLCAGTHDYQCADMPLIKSPISIGPGAWVCADAFVGPGVTIGEMAVVGARAVIIKDVAPNVIVVGNPGRVVGERQSLDRK
jgi:putative colanic acid biosynthesis acetyltransferase WcaF